MGHPWISLAFGDGATGAEVPPELLPAHHRSLEEDSVVIHQCLISEFAFIQHQQMLTNVVFENSVGCG